MMDLWLFSGTKLRTKFDTIEYDRDSKYEFILDDKIHGILKAMKKNFL